MQVVITMAGMGTRFQQVGYTEPKYQIQVRGGSLFYWSMCSLQDFFAQDFIFIVKKVDHAREFIAGECKKLGIYTYRIIEILEPTDGQASTVLAAADEWKKNDGLLVFNIDTYIKGEEISRNKLAGDGFIPCFHGQGDHWSFAKLNKKGEVIEVREKQRISEYCTLGAYYFKSCKLYETLYYDYYKGNEHLEKGEKYIAPLYNALIRRGGKVYISVADILNVHVLGTPEEVRMFEEMGNES